MSSTENQIVLSPHFSFFLHFLPLGSQYLALRFSAIIRPKSAPYKKLFKYFKSESVISFISKMFYLQVNRDRLYLWSWRQLVCLFPKCYVLL